MTARRSNNWSTWTYTYRPASRPPTSALVDLFAAEGTAQVEVHVGPEGTEFGRAGTLPIKAGSVVKVNKTASVAVHRSLGSPWDRSRIVEVVVSDADGLTFRGRSIIGTAEKWASEVAVRAVRDSILAK